MELASVKVNNSINFLSAFSKSIPRVGNFSSRLIQFVPELFDTFSLLDILPRSQETLQQLENIHESDGKNNIYTSLRTDKIITGITGLALHGGLSGLRDLI